MPLSDGLWCPLRRYNWCTGEDLRTECCRNSAEGERETMPGPKKIKLTTKKKKTATTQAASTSHAVSENGSQEPQASSQNAIETSSQIGKRSRESALVANVNSVDKKLKTGDQYDSRSSSMANGASASSSSSSAAATEGANSVSGTKHQEEEARKKEMQRRRMERLAALKQKGEFGKANSANNSNSSDAPKDSNDESTKEESEKQKKLEAAKKAAQERRMARLQKLKEKKNGEANTTGTSGSSDSGNTSNEKDYDPLDEYLSQLGYHPPSGTASNAAQTITLEEILSGENTIPEENEQEGTQVADSQNQQSVRPDDEQYRKEFIEKLRGTAKTEAETEEQDTNGENKKKKGPQTGRLFEEDVEEDTPLDFENLSPEERKSALEILHEKMAKKDLQPVDHSKIDYINFRKSFYIPALEVKNMSQEEVSKVRDDNEMKVRGRHVPNPVRSWEDCGLSDQVMSVLRKLHFEEPFPIQKQALPVIMSGRDMIGVAKTGSGKTAAYLIPMFRHILDQPPIREYEGPIGLIMAPSRELVTQIHSVAKKFANALNLRTTAVYGGASIAEQIANLKRGSDIVVCSPGRMIDLLTLNSGRVLSLERVTYLVLDEADRMFDLGFEPQIKRIIQNTRPDRQTVMFSATFPSHVESLARKILANPVEIVVGGRAKSSSDVEQFVEVRSEETKFKRLLQLLGIWYERGRTLIFVDTKEHCDLLFAELMRAGYDPLSLHGGKDQFDRDSTIADFKNGRRTVLVATSVAGRGLDVKELELVVNYNCPNHLEDYVHRVGRTGRAGRKGTAYTFITPEEGQYAPDLVKALNDNKQEVPEELQKLADEHNTKVKKGEARKRRSGYSTKGFKFDGSDLSDAQWQELLERLRHDVNAGNADAYELEKAEEEYRQWKQVKAEKRQKAQQDPQLENKSSVPNPKAMDARAQAAARAADIQRQLGMPVDAAAAYEDELEINDYPQRARWKIQTKEIVDNYIPEYSECAVSTRGVYVPPGKNPPSGQRKLHLYIEGPTKTAVAKAKAELKRILEETTMKVGFDPEQYAAMPGF